MKLYVTDHAVERYVERVKPQLGAELARREIGALLELAEPVEQPAWAADSKPADRWLQIAPDVVVPIQNGRAVTVLTPHLLEAAARRRKNEAKRKERIRKRHKRAGLRRGGRAVPDTTEGERWAS